MKIPTIRGIIDRRILVNFRVTPDSLAKILPAPFEPQSVNGWGVAGICLIRLKQVRPKHFPGFVGLASENAAHRIAVQWMDQGEFRTGVYIPRRDTSSRLNTLAGGRVFPGVHHLAKFDVAESDQQFFVSMTSHDGTSDILVDATVSDRLPSNSIFQSLESCSDFFETGSLGYSPSHLPGEYDGLELRSENWRVTPLNVSKVSSSFFDDSANFPAGAVEFDNALLMRGIDHEWHSRSKVCCGREATPLKL